MPVQNLWQDVIFAGIQGSLFVVGLLFLKYSTAMGSLVAWVSVNTFHLAP